MASDELPGFWPADIAPRFAQLPLSFLERASLGHSLACCLSAPSRPPASCPELPLTGTSHVFSCSLVPATEWEPHDIKSKGWLENKWLLLSGCAGGPGREGGFLGVAAGSHHTLQPLPLQGKLSPD